MATWVYSDWITYDVGNALRLSRLRLHIQEVSDLLASEGESYSLEGAVSQSRNLTAYLDRLKADEKELAAASSDQRLYEVHSRWRT